MAARQAAAPRAPARPTIDPYPALARAALLLAWAPGFGLGLYLLLGIVLQWDVGAGWLPLGQAHGHAQVFGFTALFILAVGTVLFPRFLSAPLTRPRQARLGGILIAVGVGLRFLLQPLEAGLTRGVGLVLAAALELVGAGLFAHATLGVARASIQPWAAWRRALALGLGSLVLGYLLNLAASLELAGGRAIVSPALDEALLHLGIWGFIVPVTLAVGLKIFPQFLLLRPPRARLFGPAIVAYGIGMALVVAGWLVQGWRPELIAEARWLRLGGWSTQTAALLLHTFALRLFEPAARRSGMPHITNPTRLWFRLAFGWLLVAVALGAFFAARESTTGSAVGFVEASAQRHALTMGYLLPLLVGMAGRILPGFSGEMTRRPRVLAGMVWLLLVGATLRVGGQLLGGYVGLAGMLTALGGTLAFLGFAWFAWLLWPTLGRKPGAVPPARGDRDGV
ncbi:MAG: NnrS family protein [Chloroflexi bacterium]|nr:NnrS family protein [Chloroflexota bacterium]